MMTRAMEEQDLDQVVSIEQACFSQPWSRQGFLDSLNGEDGLFLVAQGEADHREIRGYVGMTISIDEGEITNVAVADIYRGCGVGEALMNGLIAEARKREITRIVLEVRVSNAPAIGLYKKIGFRSVGIRKNFYEFPKEDADIMVWEDIC